MTYSYPSVLKKLIETLENIPGLGDKSSTRIAMHLLSNPELCEILGDLIKELPYRVKLCKFCRTLSEEDVCAICKDPERDSGLLCIVENPSAMLQIEKTEAYNGYYFVLHYLLSPREGIGPRELGLDQLVYLIKTRDVREVIIALSPTLGGEATASYITEYLSPYPVKVSKIACGVPMGMEINFVDHLTLKKAILRRELLKS
jgi:recombination protein RecR